MLKEKVTIKKNTDLFGYLTELLGSELNDFLEAIPEDRAIRLNTTKIMPNKTLNSISKVAELTELAYSSSGYKIKSETHPLSHTIDFFKGNFALQGASSQIPPIVLNPEPGDKVLDMAASPGSKTTQLGILMQNKGELIVNDSNLNRMQALNTNTQKTGLINHCVYYLAGERLGRLFPEYFDKVLLDTPCTGLGTLATNPEVLSWWSYQKLEKLTKIQKQLIVSAIKATKVGGEIVYSTCSVAPEENELIINDILQNYPIEVLPIKNTGMDTFDEGFTAYLGEKIHPSLKNTKRVWPHKHNMEGFFIARLRKTGEYFNKNNPKEMSLFKTLVFSDPVVNDNLKSISQSWGIDEDVWKNYRYIKTRDRIWMVNSEIKTVVKDGFTNGGMLLAEERLNIWKLTHQSIQFFAEKISKRKLSLSQREVRELFVKGICNLKGNKNGYFALEIENEVTAIVFIEKGKVKIKLPHLFNLQ